MKALLDDLDAGSSSYHRHAVTTPLGMYVALIIIQMLILLATVWVVWS